MGGFCRPYHTQLVGGFGLEWRQEPLGATGNYAAFYIGSMSILVVVPYFPRMVAMLELPKKASEGSG